MTSRRRQILTAINDLVATGVTASYRTVAEQTGTSRKLVQKQVNLLVRDGYVRRLGGVRVPGMEVLRMPGTNLLAAEIAWCNANPGRVRAMMALDAEMRS